MKKNWIFYVGMLFAFLFSAMSFAENTKQADIQFEKNKLTIKNLSNQIIHLNNATLTFYSDGHLFELKRTKEVKFKPVIQQTNFSGPHQQGNLFTIQLQDTNYPLLPGRSITLPFISDHKELPHGGQLRLADPIPVDVTVTVKNESWVQTISICNKTTNAIPLKNLEFQFNYSIPMPTNIWGQPWVAWKVASQQGTLVTLKGGTPWSPNLNPDPACTNPLTIQYNASPTSPLPSGPFVFKAEGAVPGGTGGMNIVVPVIPAAGLADPEITVQGVNSNLKQTVKWGTTWQLTNLLPGSYTIKASPVNNGQQFFVSPAITATVLNGATTTQTIQYQAVPSNKVVVTLVNAPTGSVPLTLTGKNYSFQPSVSSGTTLMLPADTYTVSSNLPGHSATITPNPLVVPTHTTLSITYQTSLRTPLLVGYFQTWNGDPQTADGTKTNLANLPSYVNVVNLSFMRPDASYQKGSLSLSGTGLEFNYSGPVLKAAIQHLHQTKPGTKVLVAVGGAAYTNWPGLNAKAVADFVLDFGLDGVDIDYEPITTGCALGADKLIHCQVDAAFQSYVEGFRSLLPRPYLITIAAYSVGAFGEGQWTNAPPSSQYTGLSLPLLRSPAAKDLDIINVMAYDAGTTFDPFQALAAYSFYFPGTISMGVEVPPEAWGGHVYTISKVNQLTSKVKETAATKNTTPAMMMWSLQKQPNGTPSETNPNAQMIATAICTNLGLMNCTQKLLING